MNHQLVRVRHSMSRKCSKLDHISTIIGTLNLVFVLCISLAGITGLAQAQDSPQSLRGKLEQAIEEASQNQLEIVSLNPTALPTIFEVELNTGELLYSDISGEYLFAGDMYAASPGGLINLSLGTRQKRTLEKIALIPEEEMIVFSPEQVKASITVFTDVDCTYCRKLHGDMQSLLDLGIEVRYLAYPRGGQAATSYNKMISVWCSSDRKESLTLAKNDEPLPEITCDTPVLEHYQIGNELGISGTPALVLSDGRVVPGYLDSARLGAMLNLI
ncbi:MAG: DsbC family protein [Gammaproteobacteria bacterium]|nr:DsbC family protein [Gammaproteobacteria bacterium]